MDYFLKSLVDAHINGEVDAFNYLEEKMSQVEELCELKVSEAMELHRVLKKTHNELPVAMMRERLRREFQRW